MAISGLVATKVEDDRSVCVLEDARVKVRHVAVWLRLHTHRGLHGLRRRLSRVVDVLAPGEAPVQRGESANVTDGVDVWLRRLHEAVDGDATKLDIEPLGEADARRGADADHRQVALQVLARLQSYAAQGAGVPLEELLDDVALEDFHPPLGVLLLQPLSDVRVEEPRHHVPLRENHSGVDAPTDEGSGALEADVATAHDDGLALAAVLADGLQGLDEGLRISFLADVEDIS
mmetsp:Transcript_143478/g.357550  ORF Transcript_143478/g.357550 Transcript_143478/m.357550 type:complete len:232 (-) Transcript_143478:512-1207(-)